MTRIWVYEKMAEDAVLEEMVEDRIFASTSLDAAPHDKPFIMYRQTSDVPLTRGDDKDQNRQNGFMIFAHDIPGDYLRIDMMIEQLKVLFGDVEDQSAGIINSSWFETSDDLRDEDMGTIVKYGRITVKYKV